MQRLVAIIWLTWKAALRFRLFWVMVVLLIGSVVTLPLVIKDDGTARGFAQILLTYTLSVITTLLGFSTLWLSCGTLARDIEENQMQVVAVKPIARWQIWLGKWLGLVSLNAVLLAIAGGSVFALMQWRSQRLSPNEQRILREEVLVARGSLKEPPRNIEAEAERLFNERTKDMPVNPAAAAIIKKQLQEAAKVDVRRPGAFRQWKINSGLRKNFLRNQPLFMRFRFYAASTNALNTYYLRIVAGPEDSAQAQVIDRTFAANAVHEIRLQPNLWDSSGILNIFVQNRDSVVVAFPVDEDLEVLYREGGFVLNFTRALLIILFWLALLAAIGLAAASFLSFPVAAFASVSLLLFAMSTGTLSSIVEAGTVMGVNEETGVAGKSVLDAVLIPMFKGMLGIFKFVEDFSPIDSLSTGRSVAWETVGMAFAKIILLLGGVIALFGMFMFHRRELAAAHNQA
jgi:hypothetical protein